MEILRFMLMPILGAIIGYSTNWLAITSLFRPHKEKRIFGVRLPFTPGLVPKEWSVLSSKIGEVLAENVLTTDTLGKNLFKPHIIDDTADFAIQQLKNFVDDPANLSQRLQAAFKLDESQVQILFEDKFCNIIDFFSENEEMRLEISKYLAMRICELLKNPKGILPEKTKETLIHYIAEKILAPLQSANIEDSLMGFAQNFFDSYSQKSADDILPKNATVLLDGFLRKNSHMAAYFVEKILDDPKIDVKLRKVLADIIKDNLGSVVGIFIKNDKIYDKIKANLIDQLRDAETQKILVDKTLSFVKRLSEKKFGDFNIPKEKVLKTASFAIEAMRKNLDGAAAEKIVSFVSDRLDRENLYDMAVRLSKTDHPSASGLEEYLAEKIYERHMPAIFLGAKKLAPRFARATLQMRLNRLNIKIDEKLRDIISAGLSRVSEKVAIYASKHIDIAGMVESKLNEFATEEAERLILEVAGKELKFITLLGGLLGFIIGFLPILV